MDKHLIILALETLLEQVNDDLKSDYSDRLLKRFMRDKERIESQIKYIKEL